MSVMTTSLFGKAFFNKSKQKLFAEQNNLRLRNPNTKMNNIEYGKT